MLRNEAGRRLSPSCHHVYGLIEDNPGISIIQITRKLNYTDRTIRWATKQLLENEFIIKVPDLKRDTRSNLFWVNPDKELSEIADGGRSTEIPSWLFGTEV
jgi:DNA-binding MarR family transcriptional regulator